MTYKASNFASSTLAVGLGGTVGDTTLQIQVGDVAKFPVINDGGVGTDFTMLVLTDAAKNYEIVKVTRHDTGSASHTIVRAQEGTAARVWQAGDSVSVRLTAGVVTQTYTHPSQSSGAHAASAISFTATGGIGSTDVQAALAELDSEKADAATTAAALATKADAAATASALALKAPLDSPAFTGTPTAPTPSTSDDSTKLATTAFVKAAATGASEQALTQYLLPSLDGGYRDLYRSGWLPSWFNQQWGGAQWGGLPDGSFGSVATGYIEDNSALGSVGSSAAMYYAAQGFQVAEAFTLDAVWVKLYKAGNPATTLTARIYTSSGGNPSAAIGSAATLACKRITSKTDGEWYQITGLAAALTAGTQYHLVLTQSTTDASNYPVWRGSVAKKYPYGNLTSGTSVPAWTPTTTQAYCFLIQNPAANALLQSSGMFDYKLGFAAGTPVNQSRAAAQPLVNFYDGKNCTVLFRGTYTASTNVLDFAYGIDHDRITLTINGSGFPVLSIYRSDRTLYQVTGTGSVTSGNHDVGFKIRTVGDGADYATLYVDGVSVGTPLTAQTFTMADALRQLGTARLGDGFGLAPTWTQDMQMTSLPSAQGWTFSASGTEANCFSIQNNRLYQNKTGAASGDNPYYSKTTAFVNATGWTVKWKVRAPFTPNTSGEQGCVVIVQDGSKRIDIAINEYFVQSKVSAAVDFTVQGDFKTQDRVFTLCGKGSDYYLLIDGRLAIDGTGKLTSASATNSIIFGDGTSTAGENADAIWSYLKYYQGGMLLPTAGANTCSEFAHWSGDRSALLPTLWNSGTPKSIKEVCGVPRNYQYETVVQREVRRGVPSGPTTTSTALVLMPDMEAYAIGGAFGISSGGTFSASTAGQFLTTGNSLDGVSLSGSVNTQDTTNTTYYKKSIQSDAVNASVGLHKIEQRWSVTAGTGTAPSTYRNLTVEARS